MPIFHLFFTHLPPYLGTHVSRKPLPALPVLAAAELAKPGLLFLVQILPEMGEKEKKTTIEVSFIPVRPAGFGSPTPPLSAATPRCGRKAEEERKGSIHFVIPRLTLLFCSSLAGGKSKAEGEGKSQGQPEQKLSSRDRHSAPEQKQALLLLITPGLLNPA